VKLIKHQIKRAIFDRRIDFSSRKVFCIGFNKTGTTSLKATMKDLGFLVGDQRKGESLLKDWKSRDFKRIINLTKSGEFFQDVPFSLPFTYIPLHLAYPEAKFILSVRSNSEDWYRSICRFHANLWSKDGQLPTANDLKNANYIYKGMPYDFNRWVFGVEDKEPYNKERLILTYERHNADVNDYFLNNPNFLQIDVSQNEDYLKLCTFLNVEPKSEGFRWLNKSE